MANLLPRDPPGTINPAKLLAWAETLPDVGAPNSPDPPAPLEIPPAAVEAVSQDTEVATRTPAATDATVHRLARISSDCNLEDDPLLKENPRYEDMRQEFEQSFAGGLRPSSGRARHLSHHGYFRRQILSQAELFVPLDPDASLDSVVVMEKASASIYDAYLLRADIAKNLNAFYRCQVVFHPSSRTYTLWTREGRVGLPGTGHQRTADNLKSLTDRFRTIFRQKTGLTWNRRYDRPSGLGGRFTFVELDYRGRAAASRVEESDRHYEGIDAHIHEGVRSLMEVMLCGGPVRKDAINEELRTVGTRSAFTAPYEYLSPWACYQGFKTLQRIYRYLESGGLIRWKAVLGASSRYRSQVPFCAGHCRTPAISSYYAIFPELKFIYRLWPQPDVASMLNEVHLQGSRQLHAYGKLSQPMHRAYSSLRHGFRRLTKPLTVEFRELKDYLAKSCHSAHGLRVELQEIYGVFIKSNLPNPYGDWIETKLGHAPFGEERLLLWHGTPLDSLLGILDLGLQIRRRGATWTGTMFGNGIYFADASSKSATFCKHRTSDGEAVLLLCEVDAGRQRIRSVQSMADGHTVVGASSGLSRCIEGRGKLGPAKWKDVSWEIVGAPNGGVVRMPTAGHISTLH
ncbi:poly polymerase catalytic domain-containing protein [Schizothecium vesticola]|uniref:Poly [ADP-ribose] polymerase n=1 Tax=Schizothecium vesticola TaxID=314040 RepID=A0AA40BRA7_9PEZI|nr:poly polymerase catalytic domain-containing protein [Schizothecium vesticola]